MLSPKPWEPEQVLRLLIYLFLGLLVMSLAVQAMAGDTKPEENWPVFVGSTLAFHAIILTLVHRFLKAHAIGWRDGFRFGNNPPRSLGIAFVASLLILPAALLLNGLSMTLFELFGQDVTLQPAVEVLQKASETKQLIAFGVMAVIAAPVVEEVLFRGIIYPAIKARGFPKLALFLSAIFFAAIHAHLVTFIALTFLGVALALLYESSDNLLTPIFAHSIFNGANFAWLVLNQ